MAGTPCPASKTVLQVVVVESMTEFQLQAQLNLRQPGCFAVSVVEKHVVVVSLADFQHGRKVEGSDGIRQWFFAQYVSEIATRTQHTATCRATRAACRIVACASRATCCIINDSTRTRCRRRTFISLNFSFKKINHRKQ